jgi:hypothetical protein
MTLCGRVSDDEVVASGCPAAPYARTGCRYALFVLFYDNQFVRKV